MSSPSQLVEILSGVDEHEYVRFTAHWMTRATDLHAEPEPTGNDVIDALVAAAAALVSYRRDGVEPTWTKKPGRGLRRFWHPGNQNMLAYSMVRSPASFIVRGIVVEEDSLTCV